MGIYPVSLILKPHVGRQFFLHAYTIYVIHDTVIIIKQLFHTQHTTEVREMPQIT